MSSVYKTIHARTVAGLTKKVNFHKENGWMPDGVIYTSIKVSHGKRRTVFSQALTQGTYAYRPE